MPLAGLKITTAVSTYTFWMLVLVQVMVGLGQSGNFYHVIPFLLASGFQPGQAMLVFSARAAASALGSIILGGLADRIGCQRALIAALLLLSTSPIVLLGARDPNISLLCVIGYALTFGLPLNASFTLGPCCGRVARAQIPWTVGRNPIFFEYLRERSGARVDRCAI